MLSLLASECALDGSWWNKPWMGLGFARDPLERPFRFVDPQVEEGILRFEYLLLADDFTWASGNAQWGWFRVRGLCLNAPYSMDIAIILGGEALALQGGDELPPGRVVLATRFEDLQVMLDRVEAAGGVRAWLTAQGVPAQLEPEMAPSDVVYEVEEAAPLWGKPPPEPPETLPEAALELRLGDLAGVVHDEMVFEMSASRVELGELIHAQMAQFFEGAERRMLLHLRPPGSWARIARTDPGQFRIRSFETPYLPIQWPRLRRDKDDLW
jgi:hypothetical protein